jgi:hypothetical protein
VIANTLVLARFLMWVSKTEDLCSVKFDFSSYLAVQSYQNSLFQSYMFAFSILIALAAWWGYATIKQGAENRAAEVARQASDNVLKKYIEQLEEHQKAFAVASKAFGSIGFMPQKEEIKEMKATTSLDAGKR